VKTAHDRPRRGAGLDEGDRRTHGEQRDHEREEREAPAAEQLGVHAPLLAEEYREQPSEREPRIDVIRTTSSRGLGSSSGSGFGPTHASGPSIPLERRHVPCVGPVDAVEEELEQRFVARVAVGDRPFRDELAIGDDADAGADVLGDVDVVRRDEDGVVASRVGDEESLDLLLDERVEVRQRLVDEDHVRLVDERLRDHHLLLLPAGEIGVQRVELAFESESFGPRRGLIGDSLRAEIADLADELEILTRREKARRRPLFREDADPPARLDRLRRRIGLEDAHRSCVRSNLSRQRPDRRRLAGTVRPEKAV